MGKLMDLLKDACQHPNYIATKVPVGYEFHVTHRCKECGNILYEKRIYDADCIETTIIDEVYFLLYTRKGRLSLLKEALLEAGITPPECWRST
jgi:hypothetical protein